MDRYGNISRGQIQQMLAGLGASRDPYQNSTPRSRKRNTQPSQYFAVSAPGRLKPGIYQRTGRGSIKPIVMFVKQPMYRPRLRFYEVAEQTAKAVWPAEFNKSLAIALATAR